MNATTLPGAPFPLGAIPVPSGTNFAVASAVDGVLLCLLDADGVQLDEEQDVEGLEPHGLHAEEGGGDDACGLRRRNARQVADARRGTGRSPSPAVSG
ncbi:MAG TPA: hypothetical protein VF486_03965 [Actinomycetes bacterium]